jgi:diguanylate cyclase (GGDEF)-like protein
MGVVSQRMQMQQMPLDMFPLGIEKIKKGEIVHIKTSSNLSSGEQKEALESSNIKSLLLIPLRQEERYTGFLGFESTVRASEWTDDDLSILRVAAEVIGSALERQRQENELKRQMHNISILYDVGKALNFLEDLTRLLNMILDRAIDIAGSQKGSIMFYDEPSGELVIRVVRGQDKEMEEKILSGELQCLRIKNGEGVAGRVFATGEPLVINDVSQDPRFTDPVHSYVQSILCVPLNVYDEAIGVINIVNKNGGGEYSEDDLHMVMALANQAAVAISNARLYEMAITDSLTRVLIRRHFMQRLETEIKRAKRYDHSLSLIMADFDNFKEVNDLYGHQAGDYVLAESGRLFRKSLRSSDFVGRYGGEEFIIALPETSLENAMLLCRRLRLLFEKTPFVYEEFKIHRTISLGAAIYPLHAADYQGLIRCADLSLYKAKRDGRDRECSYDDVLLYEKEFRSERDHE